MWSTLSSPLLAGPLWVKKISLKITSIRLEYLKPYHYMKIIFINGMSRTWNAILKRHISSICEYYKYPNICFTYKQRCIHIYKCIKIFLYLDLQIFVYLVYINVHAFECMRVCMHVCMCVYVHACVSFWLDNLYI